MDGGTKVQRAETAERTTTVDQARALILASVAPGPEEEVLLRNTVGRTLAASVVAVEDLWPFPRAAMDGVAVRSSDVASAAAGRPVRLRVAGAVYSGEVWPGDLPVGSAIHIATGTPIPNGADAVIPRELLTRDGEDVLIDAPTPAGRHVFPAGEDVRAGEQVLQAGTVLHGGHSGLLAALGYDRVRVTRRPNVAVLATGDELVSPATAPRAGQVRESNSYALAAEIEAVGAIPRMLEHARDVPDEVARRIRDGLADDALVVTGGASVGDRDLVRAELERAGASFKFVGVAVKPGGPTAFAVCAGRSVFVLPGTPGAARVAFELFVRPALCAMLGRRVLYRPDVRARLTACVKVAMGRPRYLWGWAVIDASGPRVSPLGGQGTAALRSPAEANALIEVQPGGADLMPGALVRAHLLVSDPVFAAGSGPVVIGVVGARGAGKTTLIERLIPHLGALGISTAAVKHHAHADAVDAPGTDTARFAAAGAAETVLVGPAGIVHRRVTPDQSTLDQAVATLGPVDLVLVEGYSRSSLPKILVTRLGVHTDRSVPAAPIVAVVGEGDDGLGAPEAARFDWDNLASLATRLAAAASGRAPLPGPPGSVGELPPR
jgi:molybdopterin molybdotransferase